MNRCKELDVLRISRRGPQIVSTGALYGAIGAELYDQCRGMFTYDLDYPDPEPVEQWLKQNWEAVEKYRKPKERKCKKKKKKTKSRQRKK